MRVVVTGGAGFIGANLVRRLVADDTIDDVRVIDDLSTGFRANLDACPKAPLHEGSILDADLLDETLAGADAVVHLAARPSVPRSLEDPLATHHSNATGTLQVLEAVRRAGNPHTIVASSSSVYGANPTLPRSEELRTVPLSPYAVSKLATEAYALAYGACFDVPVLAFRFFNVFGPLQGTGHAYAAAIPTFIHAGMQGRPIPVHGDGEQTRDFTFVGSLASVVAEALERRVTSIDPVNLAFGTRWSINEVIDELARQLGHELAVERYPARQGDVRHSQADRQRLEQLFPDLEPVAFETGLAETIRWFRR